ncbi:hypothetical protein RFI_10303 [Reticulomyxa filosa]|uniref:Uncharacterized protein n=1 Tax=Reticulomyxa filosa TaxID=46433 RepID=X6NKI8_RETFI|nr:hypothetical protein RFI_10303 [Reticulomyxa filosa]|eukprot:ETO26830.1 hypothetical protein RFI_10303 [Reticulomyxa filosa]
MIMLVFMDNLFFFNQTFLKKFHFLKICYLLICCLKKLKKLPTFMFLKKFCNFLFLRDNISFFSSSIIFLCFFQISIHEIFNCWQITNRILANDFQLASNGIKLFFFAHWCFVDSGNGIFYKKRDETNINVLRARNNAKKKMNLLMYYFNNKIYSPTMNVFHTMITTVVQN